MRSSERSTFRQPVRLTARRRVTNKTRRSRLLRRRMQDTASLIVPCYNESLRLDIGKIRQQLEQHPHWLWIFVDDGSTDGTAIQLAELDRDYPQLVHVLQLPHNLGKADAIRAGLMAALDQHPQPKYIGYLDADFATPPESLEEFYKLLQRRADLQGVLGVRMPLGGHRVKRELHKSLFNRCLSRLSSWVLGAKFQDLTCGAKLFRNTPEFRAAISRPFNAKGIFDVEMVSRLAMYYERSGLGAIDWNLYEYPLENWNDVGGSHRSILDYFDAFFDLGRIFWDQTWHSVPVRDALDQVELDRELAAYDQPVDAPLLTSDSRDADDISVVPQYSRENETLLMEQTLAETTSLPKIQAELTDAELDALAEADAVNSWDVDWKNNTTEQIADTLDDIDEAIDSDDDDRERRRKRKRRRDR